MASFSASKFLLCITLLFSSVNVILTAPTETNSISCESLGISSCSFAVSSAGLRCILETRVRRGGRVEFTCKTSEVEAESSLMNWVETDECVEACGLDRHTIGISSDSLLDVAFENKLCSAKCFNGCPNVVDLYFKLAAAEGVNLLNLCEAQANGGRRGTVEVKSSGAVALAASDNLTGFDESLALAPAPMVPEII